RGRHVDQVPGRSLLDRTNRRARRADLGGGAVTARWTWLLAALGGAIACGDPVHDDAVAALGPEAPGVRPGPTPRPGQPGLTCHYDPPGTRSPGRVVLAKSPDDFPGGSAP